MNEFVFEQQPREADLQQLQAGDRICAAQLLTMLEDEADSALEDAFSLLQERGITLDISGLASQSGSGEAALRLRREKQLEKAEDLIHALEEGDPLRLYLEELSTIPVCGDIRLLAASLADGDESVRTAMVNLSLSRVVELAREHTGFGVLLMDLIQEGSMGLWQSILCYQGGNFETHRDWWIRQFMAQFITLQARANGVGQKMRRAMEDYRSVDERLLTELGRNPTLEEIAEGLHMSLQETAIVADMLENARNVDKAHQASAPKDPEPEDDQAVEDTAYFQMRQRISELLSALDEADAKLLTLRFGLDGAVPMTPEAAGRQLGLTPEEVVAREAAALTILRNDR